MILTTQWINLKIYKLHYILTLEDSDYNIFVSKQITFFNNENQIELNNDLPNISMFVYGIFFIALSFLLIIALLLYGNSIYYKKYKKSKSTQ